MKAMSSITIFFCSSSRRFITRTTLPSLFNSGSESLVRISHFSTSLPESHASSSYHSSSRRSSDDVRNVRVSVWWDFENCSVPSNVNVFKVTQCITAAVRANGIKGPIQITAFGDVFQLSRSNQEALSSTGINLTHIPNGGKNSADRSLLVDLMYWVSQNPPPAHLFLISGDRDFANILHRLRMNNYNILLASTDNAPAVLCSAASIMWQWRSLVKGENLNGKHFNQPPDGPFASWYGHYRVPLEDPFAGYNETSCLQSEEHSDSNSETKVRPVPKAVVKAIRNILNSYPEGLSITELRSELWKSNVTIENDLYGHKKFSKFLLSMPYLLKLHFGKDGHFIVHGVGPKSHETCVPIPDTDTGPSTSTKDAVPLMDAKENGGQNTLVCPSEEKLALPSNLNVPKLFTDSQTPPEKQEDPQKVQEQPSLIEIKKAKEGEVNGYQENICHTVNECNMPQNSSETVIPDVKFVQSTCQSSDTGRLPASSLSTDEVITDADMKCAENVDKFSKPRGIFNRIVRWFKFWKSDENSDNLNAELSKSDEEISSPSKMQEMFTESFWNDMLEFLETPKGSVAILQAKTRQDMAQNLQQSGPSQLQSLSKTHILHLIDSLVSDKKWVVESPSQTFPFKLIKPPKPKPSNQKQSTDSDSNPQGQNRNSALPVKKKAISPKSRSQILSECQKLANEVVKEHPDGFNISNFKKLFLNRYGYNLEVQQLGYQKLATLLQIMPGIKIESNCILPSGDHLKRPKSDSSRNDNDNDNQWEELGPIARIDTKKNDYDFEKLSDNDLSDSEEETLGNKNKRRTEEDSSLLQILDSWYGNKEECSDMKSNRKFEQKKKPLKSYSFVADKLGDDKEKLINGILGSLKKSGDGSPESKLEG